MTGLALTGLPGQLAASWTIWAGRIGGKAESGNFQPRKGAKGTKKDKRET